VIALLSDGEGDGEAVAGWRKRAGGEGSVGARRIFEVIEIENKFARFVEAVGGEAGIEEAASTVGGRDAGSVAKDEEKFGDGGIFQDGIDAKRFSLQRKFSGAGHGLIVIGADEGGERDGLWRRVRNPSGSDAIGGVGRKELEPVKSDDAW